jgi:hypothetical protein
MSRQRAVSVARLSCSRSSPLPGLIPAPPLKSSNSKSNTASLAGAIASPWFAEGKRRLKNIVGNKGFRFLPGLVRVPAKRHQPVKDNLALLLVGDLDLAH